MNPAVAVYSMASRRLASARTVGLILACRFRPLTPQVVQAAKTEKQSNRWASVGHRLIVEVAIV